MSSTLEASKNCSDNLHSKNTEVLTMKQIIDISEKLIVGQSDEIYGVNTITIFYKIITVTGLLFWNSYKTVTTVIFTGGDFLEFI